MPKKAKPNNAQKELAASELTEKLASLGAITTKKMFGGIGIFCDKKMFAMITSSATAFLKTDSASAPKFEAMGAERFGKMPYHEIPETVLANTRKLKTWARASIELNKEN